MWPIPLRPVGRWCRRSSPGSACGWCSAFRTMTILKTDPAQRRSRGVMSVPDGKDNLREHPVDGNLSLCKAQTAALIEAGSPGQGRCRQVPLPGCKQGPDKKRQCRKHSKPLRFYDAFLAGREQEPEGDQQHRCNANAIKDCHGP